MPGVDLIRILICKIICKSPSIRQMRNWNIGLVFDDIKKLLSIFLCNNGITAMFLKEPLSFRNIYSEIFTAEMTCYVGFASV